MPQILGNRNQNNYNNIPNPIYSNNINNILTFKNEKEKQTPNFLQTNFGNGNNSNLGVKNKEKENKTLDELNDQFEKLQLLNPISYDNYNSYKSGKKIISNSNTNIYQIPSKNSYMKDKENINLIPNPMRNERNERNERNDRNAYNTKNNIFPSYNFGSFNQKK